MKKIMLYCALSIFLISCVKDNLPSISLKLSKNDPFKSTIVKSQFFEINNKKDTIIIGEKGTKIVIPKNAFADEKGNPTQKNITIELAEAYSLKDIILSNLTTISNGKLLETDGMIFINATHKEKNIKVNKANPLYIEMPTKKKKANMQLYDGIRDKNGNMNWINPKPLENYLIPVNLDFLDFLPDGFENEAVNYLNFHKIKPTKKAIDSLYYYLPITNEFTSDFNRNLGGGIYISGCGINSSTIQTIKSNKFNNTLISTKEFEERIWYLHKLCSKKYVEFYVDNLKKDLWEIDQMVLDLMKEKVLKKTVIVNRGGEFYVYDDAKEEYNEIQKKFIEFRNQKLTNIKEKSSYVNQLKDFYNARLTENIKKSNALRENAFKKEQNSGIRQAYKELVWERERIVMESYGYELTEFGWKNIDKNINVDNDNFIASTNNSQKISVNSIVVNYQTTNVTIQNKINYDQLYVYLVYPKIKSIVRLEEKETNKFSLLKTREFPIPLNAKLQVVSVAYNKDKIFFNTTFFNSKTEYNNDNNISILLKETSKQNLDKLLQFNESYNRSQRIKTDLNFSRSIKKDKNLKLKLLEKAMPCCDFSSKEIPVIKKDTIQIANIEI